jgi:DNA polymerase-3 subunit gamma/tau
MVLGTVTNTAVIQLVDAWLNSDGAAGLALIHEALASGADARQFSRQMVAYLRQLLLMQAAGRDLTYDGPAEHHETMLAQAQRASRQGLISAVKRFTEAALTSAGSWQPQLPLELAFIELLPDEPVAISRQPSAVSRQPQATSQSPVSEKPAVQEQEPAAPLPPPPPDEEPSPEDDAPSSVLTPHSSALTLTAVKAQWRAMTEQVGEQQRNLPALLTMGKPLALEGNTIILGFDFPIFNKKFSDTAGAVQLVGDTFSRLLGVPCHVRSVVTSEYTVPVPEEEFRALADELGGVVKEEAGD